MDKEASTHAGPRLSKQDIFSEFGIIDFGDVTESCCVSELSVFLHASAQQKENPPGEYVKHMEAMFRDKEGSGSDRGRQSDSSCTELHVVPEDIMASPLSSHDDSDGLILAGHAIAGYLRTSSLSELEWDVLFASVCARYVIDLVNLQWCLRESSDLTEHIYHEWNSKRALQRLITHGKGRVYAMWDDISKSYG